MDEVVFDNNTIAVFPNPSSGSVNILSAKTLGVIEIYNLMGQKILTQNESSNQVNINVAHLPSGTYLLKSNAYGKVAVTRFVKI